MGFRQQTNENCRKAELETTNLAREYQLPPRWQENHSRTRQRSQSLQGL